MPIPPFGAAPTPKATQTKYGTVTLAQIQSPMPLIIFPNTTFEVGANVQMPYVVPPQIQAGARIRIDAGARLVSVR